MRARLPQPVSVPGLVLVLTLVHYATQGKVDFNNDWHQVMSFECPWEKTLRSVYSIHSNDEEDRKFNFGCQDPPAGAKIISCKWTPRWVNDYKDPVSFMCDPDYILTGVQSIYDAASKDRIMRFECCTDPAYATFACHLTDYRNEFDKPLGHIVRRGKYMVGWFSDFSADKADRRHKFVECSYGPKTIIK